VVTLPQQPHRRRGSRECTRSSTIGGTSHTCAHEHSRPPRPGPARPGPARPSSSPHPAHSAGAATCSVRSGSFAGSSPDPACPGCPPGLRSLGRAAHAASSAGPPSAWPWPRSSRVAGGVEELELSIDSRRSTSASRAASGAIRRSRTANSLRSRQSTSRRLRPACRAPSPASTQRCRRRPRPLLPGLLNVAIEAVATHHATWLRIHRSLTGTVAPLASSPTGCWRDTGILPGRSPIDRTALAVATTPAIATGGDHRSLTVHLRKRLMTARAAEQEQKQASPPH